MFKNTNKLNGSVVILLITCCSFYVLQGCINKKSEQAEMVADHTKLSKLPEFTGDVYEYIAANTTYPQQAIDKQEQGNVMVDFQVDENGIVSDIKTVSGGLNPSLVQAAIKCMESMPAWVPAEKDGKRVKTRYTLPFAFRLSPAQGNIVKELTDEEYESDLAALKAEMAEMRKARAADVEEINDGNNKKETESVKAEVTAILSQGIAGKTRTYITPSSAKKS